MVIIDAFPARRYDPIQKGVDYESYRAMGDACDLATKTTINEIVDLDLSCVRLDQEKRQGETPF